MKKFNWANTLERGLWTGVQTPAGLAVADLVIQNTEIPAVSYFVAAGAAIAASILKTISVERLEYLRARRVNP